MVFLDIVVYEQFPTNKSTCDVNWYGELMRKPLLTREHLTRARSLMSLKISDIESWSGEKADWLQHINNYINIGVLLPNQHWVLHTIQRPTTLVLKCSCSMLPLLSKNISIDISNLKPEELDMAKKQCNNISEQLLNTIFSREDCAYICTMYILGKPIITPSSRQ